MRIVLERFVYAPNDSSFPWQFYSWSGEMFSERLFRFQRLGI